MGEFAHPLVTVHAMEIGQEIDVTKVCTFTNIWQLQLKYSKSDYRVYINDPPLIQRFVFQTVTMVVYVYHQTSVSAQVTM